MDNSWLKQLRDIHLPDPISLWPIAIGWYFLGALLIIYFALLITYFIRRSRRLQSRRYLLKRLEDLREQYQTEADARTIAVELSILLRRACLVSFPRREVAGLQGEQWLEFLDETGSTREFTKGIGRVLLTAPYQHQTQFDVNELLNLALRWATKNAIKISK
jgi:hypothetical protein